MTGAKFLFLQMCCENSCIDRKEEDDPILALEFSLVHDSALAVSNREVERVVVGSFFEAVWTRDLDRKLHLW